MKDNHSSAMSKRTFIQLITTLVSWLPVSNLRSNRVQFVDLDLWQLKTPRDVYAAAYAIRDHTKGNPVMATELDCMGRAACVYRFVWGAGITQHTGRIPCSFFERMAGIICDMSRVGVKSMEECEMVFERILARHMT